MMEMLGSVFFIGAIAGLAIMCLMMNILLVTIFFPKGKTELAFEDDNKHYIIKRVPKQEYHQWWVDNTKGK